MAPPLGIVEFPPVASARGQRMRSAAWCAMAVVVAIVLDAMGTPLLAFGAQLHWLDLAAAACLIAAALVPGATRRLAVWATPLDGRVLAGLLLASTQLLPGSGEAGGVVALRQALECAAIYYGLLVQVRSQPGAADSLWDVIATACVVLSAHALLGATSGLAALRTSGVAADAGWAAQSGLFKTTLFVTVLCAGRAFERGAGRGWRVLTLLGAIGSVLHALAGGTGLSAGALARLDAPLHFSNVVVLLLVLAGLGRMAWGLRRGRREHASRWRGAVLAVLLLGVMGVFGGATGGEGLRSLASIVAVLLVATGECPSGAEALPMEASPPRLKAA